ncbi:hypothetical protein [Halobaculum sp. MBLA0143]|uniref:hypothetical protein n=1 Tax=Halobaculum sp. MBLA0143 TaxID=3079933 RepID=UPI0035260E6E
MTLRPLVSLTSPADFADWFRAGTEYTLRVARALDVDPGPLPDHLERGTAAMRDDRTDVSPPLARTIAAVLLGDAAFARPFLRWTPGWYRALLAGPIALADRRLSRVAAPYADRADRTVSRPSFSTPEAVRVDDERLSSVVPELGFAERFLLADAVLHVEWFRDVATTCGLSVPDDLLTETLRESAAAYAGRRETLSQRARRAQFALFGDDAWVRDVNVSYRLNSALLSVWEGLLRRERRRLGSRLRE